MQLNCILDLLKRPASVVNMPHELLIWREDLLIVRLRTVLLISMFMNKYEDEDGQCAL